MTGTEARLRRLAAPHARARALAVLLAGGGVAAAAAALGVALSPGLVAVWGAWTAVVGAVGGAVWWLGRTRRGTTPHRVARLVERAGGARRGSIESLVTPFGEDRRASAELVALADRAGERSVDDASDAARRLLAGDTRRQLTIGVVAAVVGAGGLAAAGHGRQGAAAFWHPIGAWRDARAPVRIAVDRERVRRGDSVGVTLHVPGSTHALLWTRAPGASWRAEAVALDTGGRARRALGPLDADLFLRATSGGRRSPDLRVVVEVPPFLSELALTARYPRYLERPDEPVVPGPDTVRIPVGTQIVVSGVASAPIEQAVWVHERFPDRTARMRVRDERLEGRWVPGAPGAWRLVVTERGGGPLDGAPPRLLVRLIADSAPTVSVPVPERDTTLPLSLRQLLVIDARDDHGVTQMRVVSWRIGRTGVRDAPESTSVDVAGLGDRALVQMELDLRERRLMPGDTVRLFVEAWDNAPVPQVGRSEQRVLRLLSMQELRAATRAASRAVGAAAESLAAKQAEVAGRVRDLAHERSRAAERRGGGEDAARSGALPYEMHERAERVARGQQDVADALAELARSVDEVSRAARAAGLGDSSFLERLAEVRALLDRALSPELETRLRDLVEALERLDPDATREALQRLAEAQERLRAELERSEALFRRAAAEGALATLSADAEALADDQRQWNREAAARADSAAAASETALAGRADSLGHGIDLVASDLARVDAAVPSGPLASARERVRRAEGAMKRAANAAEGGDPAAARGGGEEAAAALAGLPAALRGVRDTLVAMWRQETLDALDRAMFETAALAARQQALARSLHRGEAGSPARAALGEVEEGTQAIERQIRQAASRHALVSPVLERALGFAQHQTAAARQEIEQGAPNTAQAAALVDQALDALNVTAHALARSRDQVAGAQSGSGLQEAMEQLARLAQEQRGLNADAQGLVPLLGPGGAAVEQQLRALAARQRALAEQLERLEAGGAADRAGALAEEARDLAAEIERGRLDPATIARQERLFRRLLDAGRTLQGEEPDDRRERVARAATADSARRALRLGPARAPAVRLPYPDWESLRRLTPEQRRLVLEYFRRLNAPD